MPKGGSGGGQVPAAPDPRKYPPPPQPRQPAPLVEGPRPRRHVDVPAVPGRGGSRDPRGTARAMGTPLRPPVGGPTGNERGNHARNQPRRPVSHLSPELEAAVANYRHDHTGPCTHPMPNGAETWDGRCIKHKGSPGERAEQRRWESKARAVMLAQQLGHQGDVVPVLTVAEAAQRDSYLGPAPVVDRVPLELL